LHCRHTTKHTTAAQSTKNCAHTTQHIPPLTGPQKGLLLGGKTSSADVTSKDVHQLILAADVKRAAAQAS
jgi:hypothetical protein